MAAIDFPTSPTNGQVYAGWIYDSSLPGWRNVNSDTGVAALSSMGLKNVVPTSVAVGSGSATVNSNGTVSFTGATSISLNGIFNSTYRNYRIDFNIDSSTGTSGSLGARVRNAGTDRSTVDYITSGVYMYAAGSIGSYNATTSAYDVGYSYQSVTSYSQFTFEVLDPAKPSRTKMRSWNIGLNSSGQAASFHTNCLHNVDQTHDGFTIYGVGASAAYTGTLSIYGFTN